MKVTAATQTTGRLGFTLDDLVPYGPGLGSASIIMKGLFELAGRMGATNITPGIILIYLLENSPEKEVAVLKNLLNINSSEDLKRRFGLSASRMWSTQAVSEDQITISGAVQLVFRRAKQVSIELEDRYVGLHHLAIALFKECELNHHTSPAISSLMGENAFTAQDIKEKLLKAYL